VLLALLLCRALLLEASLVLTELLVQLLQPLPVVLVVMVVMLLLQG
jgi:hypothetical protein